MCSHEWFLHTDQYSADVPVWSAGIWTPQQFYRVKNQTGAWSECRPSALFNRKDGTKELLRIQVLKKKWLQMPFWIKILNFSLVISTFITWLLLFPKFSPKFKWIQNCAVVTDYYGAFFNCYWLYFPTFLCAAFQNVLISKRPTCQKMRQISLGNTIHSQEQCF